MPLLAGNIRINSTLSRAYRAFSCKKCCMWHGPAE